MKFLIQKINNKVVHDFSFTLLESIKYNNWLRNEKVAEFKYYNSHPTDKNWYFKPHHQFYVPIGSVEFVIAWFQNFYHITPKPINVPVELFKFANRKIWNGNESFLDNTSGKFFVKSMDNIKGFQAIVVVETTAGVDYETKYSQEIPSGMYQFSDVINIKSEWRAFVYKGELVGLQNYGGDFMLFPDVVTIGAIIRAYKSAPIAYTLDVGIESGWNKTFVIEVHDFFSCGLYGFADHKILPYMFYKWFREYLQKNDRL